MLKTSNMHTNCIYDIPNENGITTADRCHVKNIDT